MNRISSIMREEVLTPTHSYLVFYKEGIAAWNGQSGIRFSIDTLGPVFGRLIEEYNSFAITDASDFLKKISVLDKAESVEIKDKEMTVKFRGGNGKISVPVITELDSDIPHFAIPWVDYEPDGEGAIRMNEDWKDIEQILSNDGELLWGASLGIYYDNGLLKSFDYSTYMRGADKDGDTNFFIPKNAIDLGFKGIEYAVAKDKYIFLVGNNVQYVTTALNRQEVLADISKLEDNFKAAKPYDFTLEFDIAGMKRVKAFAENAQLTFKVEGGVITLSSGRWSERFATTNAPDTSFTMRVSVLSRWVLLCTGHKIAFNENSGEWYLHGKTKNGIHYYASAIDLVTTPKKAKAAKPAVQETANLEADSDESVDSLLKMM